MNFPLGNKQEMRILPLHDTHAQTPLHYLTYKTKSNYFKYFFQIDSMSAEIHVFINVCKRIHIKKKSYMH